MVVGQYGKVVDIGTLKERQRIQIQDFLGGWRRRSRAGRQGKKGLLNIHCFK